MLLDTVRAIGGIQMVGESTLAKAERLARSSARWARGVEELATADSLADLTTDEWIVIDGLALPGATSATIDHVVVGPSGVFVIATKRWTGRITTVDGVLMRNGQSQARTTRDAHAAALAVGELLPSLSVSHVVPVLCLRKGDVPNVTIDGVLVCSITTIVHHLISRASVLGPDDVRAAARELRQRSEPAGRSSSAAVAKTDRPLMRRLLGRTSP